MVPSGGIYKPSVSVQDGCNDVHIHTSLFLLYSIVDVV